MRSQTSMISAMLWSIRSPPASYSSRIERTTSAKAGTSASGRPAAGSSMRTKRGEVARARATPRRRSSPCGSDPAGLSAWGERWSDSSRSLPRRPAPEVGPPPRDVPSPQVDLALVGEVETREDIHERGFAGAVRSDEADDLVSVELEGHPSQCLDCVER